MAKTPEYTKRAVNNYRSKFDLVQVRFPKGTKERLVEKGNVNDYICGLVLADLADQEQEIEPEQQELQETEMSECPF